MMCFLIYHMGVPYWRIKMSNKNKKQKTIIIERMFAGSYLADNIGHEIINIYKTDEGENYIYISPWGVINYKYSDVEYVLLVRLVNQHCFEILGYAGALELLLDENNLKNPKNKQKDIGILDDDRQKELIKNRKINYGGIKINELLSEQKNVIFVTYKAGEYRKVKKEVQKYYIVDEEKYKDENHFYIPGIKFSKQSLKMYFSKKEKTKAFNKLKKIIENKDYWEEKNSSKKVNIKNQKTIEDTTNILDYIGKSYDELACSNWIAYYLDNDRDLLGNFVKEILKIKTFNPQQAKIIREYHNIDLWIEDPENIIVIENKIKSGINGVNKERHDLKDKNIQSQLSKYVNYVDKNKEEGQTAYYFIFLPNYSYSGENLSAYTNGNQYTIKRYKELSDFFEKTDCNLDYYEDFRRAIKKHSFEREKDMLEITNEKMIQTIRRKKEQ